MEAVRASAAWVASRSSHVKVDLLEVEKVVDKIQGNVPKVEWDFEGIHYFDNGPLTVQYLFVLDALNFCFWPDKDLSYDHLASGLKLALEKDKTALDADRLQNYTGPQLRQLLNWPRPLPIEEERVRLLHEVGLELERSFGGEAANLVKSAGNSAATLIELITRHFPDYIVPAVLRELGILKYGSNLSCSIDSNSEIVPGSEEEVEIRACSVYAVEKMRELINKKFGKQLLSIDIDLWLWSCGVQNIALSHHRTLSIYY
ncbi:queuosine salvage protein-like isoform X2 [Oryza brachyantha]|uniref:queuosine salvage protein-like isoform X2 n=1 Tax=Oryza brachyantha TaxID=4533 RepID=UPI0003EA8906|nr:queuosine salvage protein-like isoform X2 [Oryza brachyantha]